MPKIKNTRKDKIDDLMEKLKNGPSISRVMGFSATPDREAEEQVKIWLESWIIPAVKELIPELRKK